MKKTNKLNHIKLNINDRGIFSSAKTILHRNSNILFQKLRLCIDAENLCQFKFQMDRATKEAYLNGASLMYQLMTNPDFLKDCDNIYSDDYYITNPKSELPNIAKPNPTDKSTVLFLSLEENKGVKTEIPFRGTYSILQVFHHIKINLNKIKKHNIKITLIKKDVSPNIDEILIKPRATNTLIKIVEDYYKFIDDNLALTRVPDSNEILVFNTGNSKFLYSDIFEALKKGCDISTQILILKKDNLIEIKPNIFKQK